MNTAPGARRLPSTSSAPAGGSHAGRLWRDAECSLGDVAARSAASARAAVARAGPRIPGAWAADRRSPPPRHRRKPGLPPSAFERAWFAGARRPRSSWLACGERPSRSQLCRSRRASGAIRGCLIEGDLGRALLGGVFTGIGARCFELAAEHKLLYHAGSVFASNFTTVLLDVALRAYRAQAVSTTPRRWPARAAGAQRDRQQPAPGARCSPHRTRGAGDTELVARQAQAVARWDNLAADAYRPLSTLATRLAARRQALKQRYFKPADSRIPALP